MARHVLVRLADIVRSIERRVVGKVKLDRFEPLRRCLPVVEILRALGAVDRAPERAPVVDKYASVRPWRR